MANGKIRFGKQSGGQLALVFPDGVTNTEVIVPESGALATEQYVDDRNIGFVNLTAAQTIAGVKTFSSTIGGNITGNSATATKLATARTISLTGDVSGSTTFNGSANITVVGTLKNSGVTAGNYTKVTVDAKGIVTGGSNPTTLDGYGITDADTSDQVTTKVNNAVSTAVSGLVNFAPGLLDTLDELANALGDDPNFATTVANNIGTKVTKNADIVAGTGTKVTYDAKGLVTSSTTPATLAGYSIGDAYTKTEIDTSLAAKQSTLVSGTSIKTVNGTNILGSGDIVITDTTKLPLAGGTMTGAITAIRETRVILAANNIDLATGNLFAKVIGVNTTFTVSNALSSGNVNSFILELVNGGLNVIGWWPGVRWAGGTAPVLTTGGVDILGFYSHDGGGIWHGMLLSKDSK